MTREPNPYQETADSILEHAQAIARLGSDARDATATQAAYERHVHAMRVLALSHIDPRPDREFYKALKAASADTPAVFVQLADDAIRFTIDSAAQPYRFGLWNRAQLERGDEDEDDRPGG